MRSKVSKSRLIQLSGLVGNRIIDLPVVCIRKNFVRSGYSARDKRKSIKFLKSHETLGMVSHPTFATSLTAPYIDCWCHPYRSPEDLLPRGKPQILLSESDFIDPLYVKISKKTPKRDFFCFIMGGRKGQRRKGFGLLLDSLLSVLKETKLTGIVINYSSHKLVLSSSEKKKLKSIRRHIVYKHKKYSPKGVSQVMAQSRFGFFPNYQDCSPLLLTECLVRNIPVLVNRDIYGGWKYVNDNTGAFFTLGNVNEKVDFVRYGKFYPREDFLSHYGFHKTSVRFAEWGREHFSGFQDVEKACFSGLSRFLKKGS